jgi:hydroxycarboxylate dehydrogenase B
MSGERRFEALALRAFLHAVVRAMGADEDVAAEVADHLVAANLSGHDSHGAMRILQYAAQADAGDLVPSARPAVIRENLSTALIDGRRGFGLFSVAYAMDWAIERASRVGIGTVAVRHSTHAGRLGHYANRAAERGMIGFVTVGAAGPGVGGVKLHGARSHFFGANPYAFGIPAAGRSPVVFDGSTAMIPEGKVRLARASGRTVPPGTLVDRRGEPTVDPNAFYDGGYLLPLGGDVAGHKGFGFALVSALLGGLATIDDPDPTLTGAALHVEEAHDDDPRGRVSGVFLFALDPGCFGSSRRYEEQVAETLDAAKRMPTLPGVDEVGIPGERSLRSRRAREAEGIVLPEATCRGLRDLGERYGVALESHPRAVAEP